MTAGSHAAHRYVADHSSDDDDDDDDCREVGALHARRGRPSLRYTYSIVCKGYVRYRVL